MNTASRPLVSIVTPVYNEAEYLAECIENDLAQTYENWHYTSIDSCSTDGSLEIARPIRAAVIDDGEVPVLIRLGEDAFNALGEILRLVVDRSDDADERPR